MRGEEPEANRRQRAAFSLAFLLCALVAALLVLAYAHPPLVDWPEHLAQDHAVAHQHDAGAPGAQYYQPTGWFLPYQGFRWLHIALARATGLDESLAGGVAWLVYLLGTPLASLAWLRRARRDRWASLATFALVVDANMLWGFAPHCLGTALALWGIVLARDALARGGAARVLGLAALGVALFFTHAQQTAFWALSCAALAVHAGARVPSARRRALAVLAAMVPALGCTALFLSGHGWVDGRALRDGLGAPVRVVVWESPLRALAGLTWNAGLTALGPSLALGFALALTALAWSTHRVARAHPMPHTTARTHPVDEPTLVLFALWLALALGTPSEYRGQSISPRFASAVLLALVWLAAPRAPEGAATPSLRAPRALLLAATLASLGFVHSRFAQFASHTRALDRVLAAIPPGARVATLAYETKPEGFGLPVCLRLGAYAVAQRSAMVSSGFTRTGVRYIDAFPPEVLLVREVWHPSSTGRALDLARYAAHYDYVFLHRAARTPREPFVPGSLPPGYTRSTVIDTGDFALFRIALAEPHTNEAPGR